MYQKNFWEIIFTELSDYNCFCTDKSGRYAFVEISPVSTGNTDGGDYAVAVGEYYFHTCSNAYLFAYAPDTYPASASTHSDSMSDTMVSEKAERLLNPATSHQP